MQTISSQSMMDHGAVSCTVIHDLLCMKDGGERMGGSCDQGHVKHGPDPRRHSSVLGVLGVSLVEIWDISCYRHSSSASLSRLCEHEQIPGYLTLS